MGSRANIAVQDDDGKRVYFYVHWRRDDVPELVRIALAKRERWTDASYLARIIFCTLAKGFEDEPTGYGISTTTCDMTPVFVVDVKRQLVRYETTETLAPERTDGVTFEQFIGWVDADWSRLKHATGVPVS